MFSLIKCSDASLYYLTSHIIAFSWFFLIQYWIQVSLTFSSNFLSSFFYFFSFLFFWFFSCNHVWTVFQQKSVWCWSSHADNFTLSAVFWAATLFLSWASMSVSWFFMTSWCQFTCDYFICFSFCTFALLAALQTITHSSDTLSAAVSSIMTRITRWFLTCQIVTVIYNIVWWSSFTHLSCTYCSSAEICSDTELS